ncbi:hypothetical protein NQ318_011746 [Aromia moschata]|uniref:Uncharacterized protein n=1 Tax=Aromia moschata TaxID=1265417 RepID=A0AAV8XZG4_9CUCU|nr:hypothetical protein NQ318_011746 [Aromia moschata]
MNVYPAHKFLNGLNGLKRDVKRSNTIRTPEGPQSRRLSIRGLAEIIGINKECVRQILHESFNMRKVSAKMVPKLTPGQNESRMNICADILNNSDTDPGLLDTVITCDKLCLFEDDQIQIQSEDDRIVYVHWVSEGQTVNQHYFIEALSALCERVRRRRPDFWKTKSWSKKDSSRQSTGPFCFVSDGVFFAKYGITVLEHHYTRPTLLLVKSVLKGIRFESVEAVKAKARRF